MRLPISAKTLIRLHRKIFMLRTPRILARNAYTFTLARGKKTPMLAMRVEKKHLSALSVLLAVAAVMAAVLIMPGEK